ncbi:Unknown protein, partial [Striga hermonthica]
LHGLGLHPRSSTRCCPRAPHHCRLSRTCALPLFLGPLGLGLHPRVLPSRTPRSLSLCHQTPTCPSQPPQPVRPSYALVHPTPRAPPHRAHHGP